MFVHTSGRNCLWKNNHFIQISCKCFSLASPNSEPGQGEDGENYRIQSLPLQCLPIVLGLTLEGKIGHDKLTVNSPAQLLMATSGKYGKLCFRYKNLKYIDKVDIGERKWNIQHAKYLLFVQAKYRITFQFMVNYFKIYFTLVKYFRMLVKEHDLEGQFALQWFSYRFLLWAYRK